MLPAGQGSQLPGLQPAHSERSASCRLAWAAGLQLNHRPLTVREQSSRPGAGRGVGAAWQDSHSVAGTREPACPLGLGEMWAAPPDSQAVFEVILWANLRIINLHLRSVPCPYGVWLQRGAGSFALHPFPKEPQL